MTGRTDAGTGRRALFVHDHRFIPVGDEVYSAVQYSAAHWQRYLAVFGRLTVVGRQTALQAGQSTTRLLKSSCERVDFELQPDLSGLVAQARNRLAVYRAMRRLVGEADHVIVRLPSELGLIAAGLARALNKPCLVEVVDCVWDGLWHYGTLAGRLYAPIMTWRVRRAVRRARYVQYVTQDFLQKRYPSNARYQLSCSNVELPAPSQCALNARIARIERHREHDVLVLGLIGTLTTRHKGIHTALQALALLQRDARKYRLLVLGGGDRSPWQGLATKLGVADHVSFDGTLPPGAPVLEWLDGVDLYLHPSFKEGLPRALIEAMSRGCPAVASSVGGIPELLAQDCLIRAGDAHALAERVRSLTSCRSGLIAQAHRNWNTATAYRGDTLAASRQRFLEGFRDDGLQN